MKNKSAIYVSDYRNWAQGSSAYSEMRENGSLITAQAKLLREAGIDDTIDPDAWYEYLDKNSGMFNPPADLTLNATGIRAPQTYAETKGKSLTYMGYLTATDEQLWSNIRAGYFTIVNVDGHYVMVDNQDSLANGAIYIYDSYTTSSDPRYNQTAYTSGPVPISDYASRLGGHVYRVDVAVTQKPDTPTGLTLEKTDLGLQEAITVSWTASARAEEYKVNLICTANSAKNQSKTVGGTSASFAVDAVGTYMISLTAVNKAGNSSTISSGNVIVHDNVVVTFADEDGSEISKQQVPYGGDATMPKPPAKAGHTFSNWSSDGRGLKKDTTITAKYLVDNYSVSFVDYNGKLIGKVQSVPYGGSAVAPASEDVTVKANCVFVGWDSEAYKNVTENITVTAVYAWANGDLPVVAEITSAKRNDTSTGYDLRVTLAADTYSDTTAKLLVALKTKDGKQVATEVRSVSLTPGSTTTENISVLYSDVVSTAEVSLVGVDANDATVTPKSLAVTANIDLGDEWSDWGLTVPEDAEFKESRTEYRYKDTKTITATSTPTTPTGYTLTGSAATGTYTAYGAWSGWSTTAYSSSATRKVESKPFYRFAAWICGNCGTHDPFGGSCSNCGSTVYWNEYYGETRGYNLYYETSNYWTGRGRIYNNGYWFFELDGTDNGWTGTGQPSLTHYRYADRSPYYLYTYKMTNFSDWQAEAVTASSTVTVETRTTYRFKSNTLEQTCYNYKRYKYQNVTNGKTIYTYSSAYPDSMEYPGEWEYYKTFAQLKAYVTGEDVTVYNGTGDQSWYRADVNDEGDVTVFEGKSTLEDTTGKSRTISGTMENSAGLIATLIIYKGNNSDPVASQIEYVGQTRIGDDGSYSFDLITKEEPSEVTGDFMVTLGVQGGISFLNLGKIEAPKPVYTVDFVDADGQYIGEPHYVTAGGTVEAPQAPEKPGYTFLCWDSGLKNINENMVITAIYQKDTYQVIFVDWNQTSIHVQNYSYGDALTMDSLPEQEGKKFKAWLNEKGEEVTTVTSNMIVEASYTDTTYTVVFRDKNGEVLSAQTVTYGETVTIPSYEETPEADKEFVGWTSIEEVAFVRTNVTLSPIYNYKKTTGDPQFDVNTISGSASKKLYIYTEEESTIYYKVVKASDASATDYRVTNSSYEGYSRYTGSPVTITETSVVYAYATSTAAQDSPVATKQVTIGSSEPDPDTRTECEINGHKGGTATCKSLAICTVCGEAYGSVNLSNHTGGTAVLNAKAATTTAEGYTGDTCCKGCGTVLTKGKVIEKLKDPNGGETPEETETDPVVQKKDNVIKYSTITKSYATSSQTAYLNASAGESAKLSYSSNNSNIKVDSKSGKVTIAAKYIGSATITITAAETKSYVKTVKKVTVKVNPKKPTISKVTSPSKGKIITTWGKVSPITKYQIQFSKSKSFPSGSKTSKIRDVASKYTKSTLTGFPKGTMYVRLRTYKTVSGTKYYSSWSTVKSVKVK